MSSCWPLFIGSCTGSGETAYEGALCRGSRGLDESGRDRSGKCSNHFHFHIFIRKQKQKRESSVGKTKSVIRDIENGTIRSEKCR